MKESGLYARDVKDKLSSKYFQGITNIKTHIHQEGHIYNEPGIINFFDK